MSLFQLLSLLITLVAIFGYLNYKFLRLPDTIGIMAIAMLCSIGAAVAGVFNSEVGRWAQSTISGIDFTALIFHGLLGPLLFAGSLHVNFSALAREKWTIVLLASLGVVISTVVVGVLFHYGLAAMGIDLSMLWCLVFGALISPTDPLAVLGILRQAGVPDTLQTKITGESLFNDGIGVLIFVTLLGLATGAREFDAASISLTLIREAIGGVLFGIALGYLAVLVLRSIDSYAVEIMITLALATGGYALAELLHLSAPIAVVVTGLVIGNHGRELAMSARTRQQLFAFWELADDLLNLLLFGLVGLELVAVAQSELDFIEAALLAVPIVLLARVVSVAIPISALGRFRRFERNTIRILTWGGLRGAISIALALSLPHGETRDIIVAATYFVAVFSILVQAISLPSLIRRWMGAAAGAE
ncbi:MAG: sodium:proton antiporter [Pseudomonadota bacterium]|nr:sodium:proton antiporter [Pseudomonadota bacterium]